MASIIEPITVVKKLGGKQVKRKIGELHVEEKQAILNLSKQSEEHFSGGAWKIYTNLLNFLVESKYTIIIKDDVTKWIFSISATDFLYHCKVQSRYSVVKAELFEVTKAKNRTQVIKCLVIKCPHNFGGQCLKGSIQLSEEGVCKWLSN